MNAIRNIEEEEFQNRGQEELTFVLNKLYEGIKDVTSNKTQEISVTCYYQGGEDFGGYMDASDLLTNNKVIEGYETYSTGQEDVLIDLDEYGIEKGLIYFSKNMYKVRPRKLINYMIATSRIPKYSLHLNAGNELLLNHKRKLTKFDYDGTNQIFMEHVLVNSGKTIRKEDFEQKKRLIGDLGLKKLKNKSFFKILEQTFKKMPELGRVFFPSISQNSTFFRNNVTQETISREEIKEKEIKAFLDGRP